MQHGNAFPGIHVQSRCRACLCCAACLHQRVGKLAAHTLTHGHVRMHNVLMPIRLIVQPLQLCGLSQTRHGFPKMDIAKKCIHLHMLQSCTVQCLPSRLDTNSPEWLPDDMSSLATMYPAGSSDDACYRTSHATPVQSMAELGSQYAGLCTTNLRSDGPLGCQKALAGCA